MVAVPALDRVVVVLGHAADAIRERIEFGAAEIVVCDEWERGQSASLRCGVAALAGVETVVITLGDQPFITPQVIAGALGELGDHDAVRATYDGKPGHPVVLSRRVLDAAGDLEGDMGARELLARFGVRRWEAGHLCSAVDIDTREELERHELSGAEVAAGDVPPEAVAGAAGAAPQAPTGTEVTAGEAAPEAVAAADPDAQSPPDAESAAASASAALPPPSTTV
jgi:molybdenum cofactor cytidylyltransferase